MENIIKALAPKTAELENHSIYQSITSLERLRVFMSYHVYCVWDFMSLLKYLQHEFAPTSFPWKPNPNTEITRFVNDIVKEEESDCDFDGQFMSHFHMYRLAMQEINVPVKNIDLFLEQVTVQGIDRALLLANIPTASKQFINTTFEFIASKQAHIVASAFALGREHIIPIMFKKTLSKFKITRHQAPYFHFYLNRHIELDGDHHGPLSLKMIEVLCKNDPVKIAQVTQTAIQALDARIKLWDQVELAMNTCERKNTRPSAGLSIHSRSPLMRQ